MSKKIIPVVLLILCVISIVVLGWRDFAFSNLSDDVGLYFGWAEKYYQNLIPFKDYQIEYPPFALIFMLLPYFFGGRSIETYRIVFSVINGLLLLIPCVFFILYQKKYWKALVFIGLLLLFPAEIIFQRIDVQMAILMFLSLASFEEKQVNTAVVFLALATSLKFIPIILLPVLILLIRNPKKMVWPAVIFLTTIGITLLPFFLRGVTVSEALYFWDYNKNREIQLESTWSTLGMIFFQPVNVYTAYGAKNLEFAVSKILAGWAIYVSVLSLLVVYGVSYWKKMNNTYLIACLSLMVLILFNKVFSPQYLLWIIPLIPALMEPLTRLHRILFGSLMAAIIVFTHLVVPVYYLQLIELQPFAVVLLSIRNILFLIAVIYLFILFWQYGQKRLHSAPHV